MTPGELQEMLRKQALNTRYGKRVEQMRKAEKYVEETFAGYRVVDHRSKQMECGIEYTFNLFHELTGANCYYDIYIPFLEGIRSFDDPCAEAVNRAVDLVMALTALSNKEKTKGGNDADEEAPDHGNARPGNGEIHG